MRNNRLLWILLCSVCLLIISASIVFLFYDYGYFGCKFEVSKNGNLTYVSGKTRGHFVFPTEIDGKKVTTLYCTGFSEYDKYFSRQNRVVSITIPDGITEVNWAIEYCENLREIHIGKDVENFFPYLLYSAHLDNIYVDPENPYYYVTDGCLMDARTNDLILATDYSNIPDGTIWIGVHAFCGRNMSPNLIIPDSVKYIADYAFAYCTGLKNVYIPKSVVGVVNTAFELAPEDVHFWFEVESSEEVKTYDWFKNHFPEDQAHFGVEMPNKAAY